MAPLCGDIARLIRRQFIEEVRDMNFPVTGPQFRVLLFLDRLPGISQGRLADELDVEPFSAGRMVDRLEQAGLVERRHNPNDRRAWQLFLTDTAQPIIATMVEIGEKMNSEALSESTEEEVRIAYSVLIKMRNKLMNSRG